MSISDLALSDLEIKNLIDSFYFKKYFYQVTCKDTLIFPDEDVYFSVINLQNDKDGNGTHWVMFIKVFSNIYYFDSYGQPPFLRLEQFSKKNNIFLTYNSKKYQNDNWSCGYWCIFELIKIFGNY